MNNIFPNINVTGLDELETYLYNKLYVENKPMIDILEEVMRQNGIYDSIVPQSDADKHEVYNYTDHYTIYNDKGDIDFKLFSGYEIFPIWADSLCAMDDNPMIGNWDNLPKWQQNFIRKNSDLWSLNKTFVAKWLPKAKKNPLFFGSKAKLEWQAGETKSPNLWDHIMQVRPSGLRVKPGTYFPALVAITQTSIVGKRKRFLTPRECARLQSFPDTFKYDEKNAQAYKQFGNSINVGLVKLFAQYMFGNKEIRKKYSYKSQFNNDEPSLFDSLND